MRGFYIALSDVLLQLGEPAEASRLAEQFPRLLPEQADEYRRAAELLGRCFTLAQAIKDIKFDSEDCVRRVSQLLAEGASKGPLDAAKLQQSPAFKVFADRPEIQQALEKAAKPDTKK